MKIGQQFEELWQDIRFGARQLRLSPGFSTVAILTLALGIGANTAVFSVVNSILLRPIVAEAPDELVAVYSKDTARPDVYRSFSYPNYVDLRDSDTVFTSLLAHDLTMVGVTDGEATRRVFADLVSANYFETFGVPMFRGRAFLPAEEAPGSGIPVVVVGHGYWQRAGADPALVGKTLTINGQVLTVVGIAPPNFTGRTATFAGEVFLPLGMHHLLMNEMFTEDARSLGERDNHRLMLVGRLRPGVSRELADRELAAVASRMEEAFPAANRNQTFIVGRLSRVSISNAPEDGDVMFPVALLMLAMTGIVLLIACINLASMLLARGTTRRREFAIRSAIGGGRGRIVRQILTEGLLLSLLGGLAGLYIAYWASNLLASSIRQMLAVNTLSMEVVLHAAPDYRVLLAATGFCVVSTVLFGLGPALRSSRPDLATDLKDDGAVRAGAVRGRLLGGRQLLVVAQIALSLVLLISAGLFMRSAGRAAAADPGFPVENSLLVEIDPSLVGYDDAAARDLYGRLLGRLSSIPGVEAVSVAATVPFGNVSNGERVRRAEDLPTIVDGEATDVESVGARHNVIGDDYFRTLGVPVLQGRPFTAEEALFAGGPPVAIVDQELANRLWPGQSPIGRQIGFGREPDPTAPDLQVVGVVPTLREDLFISGPEAHVYVPFGQDFQAGMNIHVRTAPGTQDAAMLQSLRQEIQATDAQLPIMGLKTLSSHVANGAERWIVGLGANTFALFGSLSLFLAVVGVYGVKAFAVAQRRREIGIRMALGATAGNTLWLILREGAVLTAAGLGLGLVLSVGVAQLLSSLLYEVSALDPLAFTVAPLILAAVATLATYVPALRAARVGPTAALRTG